VLAARGLVVVHVDALQLQIGAPWYDPSGSMPCSSEMTSQNLAPICPTLTTGCGQSHAPFQMKCSSCFTQFFTAAVR
jgi:hypothetical protein